jgi:hypothetical protein
MMKRNDQKPLPAGTTNASMDCPLPDWTEHEHVADHARVQARQLVDEVGTPELAKLAIDAAVREMDSPQPASGAHAVVEKPDPLTSSLAQLETALLTPIVSGELEPWVAAMQRALSQAMVALRHQLDVVHPAQLAEIGRRDPEMLPRVEQLREQDQQVRDAVAQLQERSSTLDSRAERVGSDEARVRDHLPAFIELGLATILQVRKQETTVRTWFVESFQRDKGVVD